MSSYLVCVPLLTGGVVCLSPLLCVCHVTVLVIKGDMEVRVARIFNTFGPRMHPNDGRVVSNFIIQAVQGKDITIYGKTIQEGP